jgi:hypothetical protein
VDRQQFDDFKLDGRIRAQAARFRIWEYRVENGKLVPSREVSLNDSDILNVTWHVHLANLKASFFEFHGQKGAADNFETLRLENRRNAQVPESKRARMLEIDPGPRSISEKNQTSVSVDTGQRRHIPIHYLGELHTDIAGRLFVLGGKGLSDYSESLPLPSKVTRPTVERGTINDYANNDTWFDDISDGPVEAIITYKCPDGSQKAVKAEGAWVLVAPPDFAPSVGNVVTLYDTLWDLAVRELSVPPNSALYDDYAPGRGLKRLRQMNQEYGANRSLANIRPSFTREIFPILYRALTMRWVHSPLTKGGVSIPHIRSNDFSKLAAPSGSRSLRMSILHRLRNPESSEFRPMAMPQSLGDDYDLLDRQVASGFLSLTKTQYWMLHNWAEGNFESDWQGVPPRPTQEDISPEGLDRAALENCVGGAFYPGIEVSWLIRKSDLFSEPFRIRRAAKIGKLTVGAGFFSQQMALPWQADFYECARESWNNGGISHAWWPGQRPDDVFLESNQREQKEWARGIRSKKENVRRWSSGFVLERDGGFYETEGPEHPNKRGKR